ncbi:helix-turn-helix transcriptional regulator [Nonomuraea sp. NPDC049152]|uniref:helix-turn-helix transcriptional regulator n=1 Tax=Nonomuraea sp. NPDC049152 TaxID=3154350 RepID=UPI0033F54D6D
MVDTLQRHRLAATGAMVIEDVREPAELQNPAWTPLRETTSCSVVLVRAGGFLREAQGQRHFVDSTGGYVNALDIEERYANATKGPDASTVIRLPPDIYHDLVAGIEGQGGWRISTSPEFDLRHRMLLAACWQGTDDFEVSERLLNLLQLLPRRTARDGPGARPATERAHRALVAAVQEAFNSGHLIVSLEELANLVNSSPHHLSRVFRRLTGRTITAYRNELRVRAVLERLAAGTGNLAELATLYGFADHAHLARTVRRHTAHSPSALRGRLSMNVQARPMDSP